ncbi:sensor histidine kinase [Gordonia soli]|uniref:Putative two-component histidine kinase n=1 Tax=Gordonia soli NBRC 108243 TaxID=1223545 RepID=M0QJX0_9ACTN|nr:putative two-component histidine kinase [Gordonia soli]GAC67737.1 putative two-component histidine kinase [Gordonia soli NBRC 108243]
MQTIPRPLIRRLQRRAAAGRADGLRSVPETTEDGSDLVRLQRFGSRFVGAGLIGYALAMAPGTIAYAHLTAAWWAPVSIILVVVPAGTMIVASFRPRFDRATALAVFVATAYLATILLWFVAWDHDVPDAVSGWPVWVVQLTGATSLVWAVALRFRMAVVHLVVVTVVAQTANQLGSRGHVEVLLYLNSVLTVGLAGVFLAIALVAVRTAMTLDATRTEARQSAAEAAAAVARESERGRYDALIHDTVIASLLAIRAGRPEERLMRQACATLDELDRWHRGDEDDPTVLVATEALRRIRATATAIDDEVLVEIAVPDGAMEIPADVVQAVTSALGEALRNSVGHAGPGADRVVGGWLGVDDLQVAVVDDGVGFEVDSVGVRRLGIDQGIRRRMEAVGGTATVSSSVGLGTAVVLGWQRS